MTQPAAGTVVVGFGAVERNVGAVAAPRMGWVAIPSADSTYGYLSEHHPFGETDEKCGEYAEDMAATMLATTLGIEFNPDTAWDEREQVFKASGKIFKTFNFTQSAEGDKNGLWTSVLASAVLIFE